MKKTNRIAATAVVAVALASCTTDPNAPGVEYMPDMYRSPAVEAYTDYGTATTLDLTQERKDKAGFRPVLAMKPVPGTIAYSGSQENAWMNMPYPLANTVEDYEKAATMIACPPSIGATKKDIEAGRAVYTMMCLHCHGEAGHGDGTIAARGKILGIPDYATKLKDLPEGKMYHTLYYGKGLMGSHASQINAKERWQVIQWVKCLQLGITDPQYDDAGNLVIPPANP